MSDRSSQAVGEAAQVAAVGPVQPAGPRPITSTEPARRPLPGVDEFDTIELSSGATTVQAYAKFTVQPKTGAVSIKIIDARTDQVIREIPPEDVLRIAEELQAYLATRRAVRS